MRKYGELADEIQSIRDPVVVRHETMSSAHWITSETYDPILTRGGIDAGCALRWDDMLGCEDYAAQLVERWPDPQARCSKHVDRCRRLVVCL